MCVSVVLEKVHPAWWSKCSIMEGAITGKPVTRPATRLGAFGTAPHPRHLARAQVPDTGELGCRLVNVAEQNRRPPCGTPRYGFADPKPYHRINPPVRIPSVGCDVCTDLARKMFHPCGKFMMGASLNERGCASHGVRHGRRLVTLYRSQYCL